MDTTEQLSSSPFYVQKTKTPRKPGVGYTILLTVGIGGHMLGRGGHAAFGRPLWGASGCCGQEHAGLVQLEDRQPLLLPQ